VNFVLNIIYKGISNLETAGNLNGGRDCWKTPTRMARERNTAAAGIRQEEQGVTKTGSRLTAEDKMGRVLQMSQLQNMPPLSSHIHETLESAKNALGFQGMDISSLENRLVQAVKATPSGMAMLSLSENLPDFGHGQEQKELNRVEKRRREECANSDKGLKDYGLKKQKAGSMEEDNSIAPAEKRYQKIQSLYAELQKVQDANYALCASIKQRESQLSSLSRDNAMLWSMAAHIGMSIQQAIEAREKLHALPHNHQEIGHKVSSQADDLVQEKTPGNKDLPNADEELYELFSPGTQEIFAACRLFASPLNQPNIPRTVQPNNAVEKTPAKIEFPAQEENSEMIPTQQDSFSFQNVA